MPVSILTIIFENQHLRTHDIPEWRRMVNDVVGWQEPLLHNHTSEGGETHAYPLVQFRAIGGRGALLGIGEGTSVLLRILPLLQTELGKAQLDLDQARVAIAPNNALVYHYALYRWLALSPINYQAWRQTRSLAAHVQQLERILSGQLLGLLKTLGIDPLPVVSVEIEHLDERGHFSIPTDKGEVQHLAFDIKFSCSVSLPPQQLGIGKFSSKGYGILQNSSKLDSLNKRAT